MFDDCVVGHEHVVWWSVVAHEMPTFAWGSIPAYFGGSGAIRHLEFAESANLPECRSTIMLSEGSRL